MRLTIESTSNPTILKFVYDEFLTNHTSYEFKNIDEAKNSPLAQQLFYLPFVKTVYISSNFIAIERYDIVQWSEVQNEVADQINSYLENGGKVIAEELHSKKVPITVYAESTPNPSTLKFVANKKLVLSAEEYKSIDDTKHAPMAQELFHFPFVKSIYMDENFVSITKYDMADWNDITLELREFIRKYIEEGKSIVTKHTDSKPSPNQTTGSKSTEPLDVISHQIVSILNEYVKPAVASDGGNIEFDSYDPVSKKVKVILQGACSGCPSSTFTLKNGIENMLKEMLQDKVEIVEAING